VKKKKGKDEIEYDKFDISKLILEGLFKKAKAEGVRLWPDEAMLELTRLLKKAAKNNPPSTNIEDKRIDLIAYWRDLHIYAVKLHYRTYHPRKGAPRISAEHGNKLLEMYEKEGMSYKDIALSLEPHLKTADDIERGEGKIRKRIQSAKKRRGDSKA
jgi:hypothetical protein